MNHISDHSTYLVPGRRRGSLALATLLAVAGLLATAAEAGGVTIGDITRVEGQRINKLNGLGLVVGLSGTGDGGEYVLAMRPLAALLQRMGDPAVSEKEFKGTKNVAIVTVTATIPASGVRKGDRLDIQVQSIGAAKSLKGGRLVMTPLQGPQKNSVVYALAEGPIRIEQGLTSGVVDGGAVMEEEVLTDFVENHKFRLVIAEPFAGFATAAEIAQVINERNIYTVGHEIAKALDARTVEVAVPDFQQANPVPFLGDVQKLSLRNPPETAARVEINERTGTIVITGNVEMSPAVISHPMLNVSTLSTSSATAVVPGGASAAGATTGTGPAMTDGPFVKIDPSGQGGVRLQDLVNAMNVLKVPAADQIAIIKLLSKSGRIHAEVIFVE
jgi:flagellar P-ring protein precursor FlgI